MTDDKAERLSIASREWNVDGKTITYTWADGKTTTFNIGDLPDDIKTLLLLHGAEQKLSDCYSGAAKASPDDPIGWARGVQAEVWEGLMSGDWNRAGGGSGPGRLARAVSEAYGIPLDVATERCRDWNRAAAAKGPNKKPTADAMAARKQLATIRGNVKVKAVLLRMEQESLDKKAKTAADRPADEKAEGNLLKMFQ